MFHLILTVCLAAASGNCAPVLLPEGDAATQQDCEAQAQRIAQDWLTARPDLVGGPTTCRANADLPASDLQEVAPSVHVHVGQIMQMEQSQDGRIANLGVVVGRDSVAVIDAGVSRAEGQALYVALRRLTDKPVSDLVLTHAHPDHIFGASVLAEAGARIWGHRTLPQALTNRGPIYLENLARLYEPTQWVATQTVLPDQTVATTARIDLGGRSLLLTAWPAAHTDGDLTVLDEETGTFFTGDLLFRGLAPVLDGSLRGWLKWMNESAPMGARIIVPGHGQPAASWAEAAGPQYRFLKALADETGRQIDNNIPMSEAVPRIVRAMANEAEFWEAFEETVARDATAAYKELEWE
nr:quinoprotein relay system zinc metallohydrolase 2 [Paracoccus saliphilus]